MKDLKDYLHLYVSTSCQFKERKSGSMFTRKLEATDIDHFFQEEFYIFIKPVLRSLSDMTEEEAKEMANLYFKDCDMSKVVVGKTSYGDVTISYYSSFDCFNIDGKHTFKQTAYLLKRGFDLFGLIDDDLAIDKTKL